MIKLIVSDLDGSLLDENSKLNPEFFEVYKQLKERGIIFCAASGRAYWSIVEHFEEIKDEMHVISSNGAMLYKGCELIHSYYMNREIVDLIYQYTMEYPNAFFGFSTMERLMAITNSDESFDFVNAHYGTYERLYDINNFSGDVFQCGIFDPSQILQIKQEVFDKIPHDLKKHVRYISSGHTWLDILNVDTNKGNMIGMIQEDYGIKASETVVFGDYDNDLQMFDFAQYGYAMENAQEVVKQRAPYICKSNAQNGVIDKIKEILDGKF